MNYIKTRNTSQYYLRRHVYYHINEFTHILFIQNVFLIHSTIIIAIFNSPQDKGPKLQRYCLYLNDADNIFQFFPGRKLELINTRTCSNTPCNFQT